MTDPNASEKREYERAELALTAAVALLELQAFDRDRKSGELEGREVSDRSWLQLELERAEILLASFRQFATAVREHCTAEHAPGVAADALHAAARSYIASVDGDRSQIDSRSWVYAQAGRGFVDAEKKVRPTAPVCGACGLAMCRGASDPTLLCPTIYRTPSGPPYDRCRLCKAPITGGGVACTPGCPAHHPSESA